MIIKLSFWKMLMHIVVKLWLFTLLWSFIVLRHDSKKYFLELKESLFIKVFRWFSMIFECMILFLVWHGFNCILHSLNEFIIIFPVSFIRQYEHKNCLLGFQIFYSWHHHLHFLLLLNAKFNHVVLIVFLSSELLPCYEHLKKEK